VCVDGWGGGDDAEIRTQRTCYQEGDYNMKAQRMLLRPCYVG
jgi:hypothetical protein